MRMDKKKRKKGRIRRLDWRRGIPLFFFVVFFILVSFIIAFVFPSYVISQQISSVSLSLYMPKYLAANDENLIRAAIENTGEYPVTVMVRLSNQGPPMSFVGSETNTLYSGVVESHEQINRQLSIFVPLADGTLNHTVQMILQANINGIPWEETLQFQIMPAPYLRSAARHLNALLLGLIGSVVGWIIEEFRDTFRPSERQRTKEKR